MTRLFCWHIADSKILDRSCNLTNSPLQLALAKAFAKAKCVSFVLASTIFLPRWLLSINQRNFVLPTSFILNKLLKLKKNWSVTWVYGSNRQKIERVVFCLYLTTIVLLQTQHLLLENTFSGFSLLGRWRQSAAHHPKMCSSHPSWKNSPKGKPPSPH